MNSGSPTGRATREHVDMDLVAQRILKLAEIAMLDHLEAIERSQAATISHREPAGRRMCPGSGQ